MKYLSKILTPAYIVATLLASLVVPTSVGATSAAYTQDTTVIVNAVPVLIAAGSVYDGFSAAATSFTVTVPAGEAFIVRTTDPRASLENDAMLAACNVTKAKANQMIINGPRTVTVFPQSQICSASNSNSDDTPSFTFSAPAVGATFDMDQATQLLWTTSGRSVASVRIRLSTDNGATYPTMVADGILNNGFLAWQIPHVVSTTKARLKIEGIEQGNVVAMSVSDAFTINGTIPPLGTGGTITVTPYDYVPVAETVDASTISIDKSLPNRPELWICNPDSRIKAKGFSTVYYCGRDGKRYVFPNQKAYDTWYEGDFAGVIELDLADMQRIPLGGNVTYRPGVRMVKLTTAKEVFAVAGDGTLRFVPTEAVAARLYGPKWNTMIDDLPDAFFADYQLGEPIQ